MMNNKIYCKCGCGKQIDIKPWHKYKMPFYINGHNNKGKKKIFKNKNKWIENIRKGINSKIKNDVEYRKHYILKKTGINRKCLFCNNEFYVQKNVIKTKKFCCRICYNKWQIGKSWKERLGEKRYKETHEKNLKGILKGLMKRPTSFEQKIIFINKKYNLPFKYVGDGQIIINYVNPDFISTNNDKLIIEVFYTYFKIKSFNNVQNYKKIRTKRFKKYGYRTLFLDEEDILNKNWEKRCLIKINNFIGDSIV